jgi:hypothetical protein
VACCATVNIFLKIFIYRKKTAEGTNCPSWAELERSLRLDAGKLQFVWISGEKVSNSSTPSRLGCAQDHSKWRPTCGIDARCLCGASIATVEFLGKS